MRPKGEWMPRRLQERGKLARITGFRRGSRPGRLRNRTERRSREWNGFATVCCVESKAQVGNVDLAMVAKVPLRASERPFRNSGSGRMPGLIRLLQ